MYIDWQRQQGEFHAVAGVVFGVRVLARCRLEWPDGLDNEHHDDPPDNERCDACQRELVNDGMIWRGLRELMAVQA